MQTFSLHEASHRRAGTLDLWMLCVVHYWQGGGGWGGGGYRGVGKTFHTLDSANKHVTNQLTISLRACSGLERGRRSAAGLLMDIGLPAQSFWSRERGFEINYCES